MRDRGASFRLDGVSVTYGETVALSDVDLELEPGEAVGFVGPSGSGKTTLLKLLNGTVRPTSGSVCVNGANLASLNPRGLRALRSRIATVHQDLSLVPNLRVIRNVLLGRLGRLSLLSTLRLLLLPPRTEVLRVHEILERVGIGEKLYERTDRLSGGQRQRVAIARALYQEPSALLPDEPVSSLDPARSRDTMGLLLELSRETGMTLCVSLHDLEVAREFVPRLVGLRRGKVVLDQPTAELGDDDFRDLYDLTAEELLGGA